MNIHTLQFENFKELEGWLNNIKLKFKINIQALTQSGETYTIIYEVEHINQII